MAGFPKENLSLRWRKAEYFAVQGGLLELVCLAATRSAGASLFLGNRMTQRVDPDPRTSI
jgi:hypothetical protein